MSNVCSYNYLEHLLIVDTRRGLQRSGSSVAKSPSSCNIHAMHGCLLESSTHFRLSRWIGCHIHQPIRIKTIEIKGLSIKHEMGSARFDKIISMNALPTASFNFSSLKPREDTNKSKEDNGVEQSLLYHFFMLIQLNSTYMNGMKC